MANVLTGIRIICGILILVFPAFSGWYYLFYLLGGFTDAIDGTVARRTGKANDFGAKFDTAADMIFVVAVVVKIIDALYFPTWLIVWITSIFAVKIANVLYGLIKYKQFITVHSAMNKVCGAAVFVQPLIIGSGLPWQVRMLSLIVACIVATTAAIKENGDIRKWQSNF